MRKKIEEQIKMYKYMIKAYDNMIEENFYDLDVLRSKRGTLLMVIEDLENLLKEGE